MTTDEERAGRTTASDTPVLNPVAPADVPDARLDVLLWNDHWLGYDPGDPISGTLEANCRGA